MITIKGSFLPPAPIGPACHNRPTAGAGAAAAAPIHICCTSRLKIAAVKNHLAIDRTNDCCGHCYCGYNSHQTLLSMHLIVVATKPSPTSVFCSSLLSCLGLGWQRCMHMGSTKPPHTTYTRKRIRQRLIAAATDVSADGELLLLVRRRNRCETSGLRRPY